MMEFLAAAVLCFVMMGSTSSIFRATLLTMLRFYPAIAFACLLAIGCLARYQQALHNYHIHTCNAQSENEAMAIIAIRVACILKRLHNHVIVVIIVSIMIIIINIIIIIIRTGNMGVPKMEMAARQEEEGSKHGFGSK